LAKQVVRTPAPWAKPAAGTAAWPAAGTIAKVAVAGAMWIVIVVGLAMN